MKKDNSANYEWMIGAHGYKMNPYIRKGNVGGLEGLHTSPLSKQLSLIPTTKNSWP